MFKKLQEIFIDSLKDVNDSFSSKRITAMCAFITCQIGFFANLFFGLKVEQFMFDSMMYICIAGIGLAATEKFAPKSITKGKSGADSE